MAVKLNYRAWFNPHALFIKLVTLFCFVTKLSFSQNFILNLNLNNCSNCNANIYLLKEYFNNQNLNIILPVKFKGDSLDIVEKYEFNFSKWNILFNDSLYTKYSEYNKESTLIIFNDNKMFISEIRLSELANY
ncbi:MAG: hypothetical protein RLZZ118_2281, partial [Bacteroidota bacterium]